MEKQQASGSGSVDNTTNSKLGSMTDAKFVHEKYVTDYIKKNEI